MASVYFDPALGGDGSTVSDDRDPLTGLRGGGYTVRFVPALANTLAVSAFTVSQALAASSSASDAAASASSAGAFSASANTFATSAQSFASLSQVSASNAAQSLVGIQNYIIGTDFYKTYTTYSAAFNDFLNRQDGQIVKVLNDETRSGRVSYYLVDFVDPISLQLKFTAGDYRIGNAIDQLTFAREEDFSRVLTAPASSTAPGSVGDIFIDASFLYYCYAPNAWRRIASSTF